MADAAPETDPEIVFKTRDRRSCHEPQLVLASAGISSELFKRDGWWVITVAADHGAAALDELRLHQQDNANQPPQRLHGFPCLAVRWVVLASLRW